jgi:zinc transporter ZupT
MPGYTGRQFILHSSFSFMSTLAWIVAATIVGAVLSVLAAAAFALRASPARIPMLISYAIGALLGAAFLEILPHALEQAASVHTLTAVILFGVLSFSCWRNWYCGAIVTPRNAKRTIITPIPATTAAAA